MQSIRLAQIGDEQMISEQRCRMFQDNDLTCVISWESLAQHSQSWLEERLRDQSYVGWMVEEESQVIGGAGVWFMDWPPHYLHAEPVRAYLMNFYVIPEARGKGVAAKLLDLATEECKRRGIRTAVLHASKMGMPLYERRGWMRNNEMMLVWRQLFFPLNDN